MSPAAGDSLVGLQVHWRDQAAPRLGSLQLDWLGEQIAGGWFVEQVARERESIRGLLGDQAETQRIVVGIALPNGIENLVLGVALALEGITQAILPLTASSTEQATLSRRFGLTHRMGVASPDGPEAWVGLGNSAQELNCWHWSGPEHQPSQAPEEDRHDHLLLLGTTSGTSSGRPGLVMRHARTLQSQVRAERWSPYNLLQRPLLTPELQHWSARYFKLRHLLRGGSFVVRHPEQTPADSPLPEDCDGTTAAPGSLRRLLARGDLLHYPSDFLLISGSDRVPMELRRAVAQAGSVRLGITYATSQTGPLTWLPPEALLEEADSVGWLLPDVTMEPLDGGSRCEQRGLIFSEALITTPSIRLNPGDLLGRSASGQVIFGGRANDTFLFNSVLISPLELEDVLMQHPGLRDCVVFGATSERFGGVPMAAIIPHALWQAEVLIQELDQLCRAALGPRRPRRYILTEAIPKGATGKTLRRELSTLHSLGQ
jgi:acyl-CoA synthetase (AMP-forming)/AMP-acid ligase II